MQVSPLVSSVLQDQVGVPVEEGPHLRRLQQHRLHLLHPPHLQALFPGVRPKLTRHCLEVKHSARGEETGEGWLSEEKGRIDGGGWGEKKMSVKHGTMIWERKVGKTEDG